MPDETGTDTPSTDASSVAESLFGDAEDSTDDMADDAAAVVAEEEDADNETQQDPEDADDGGDEAGKPEELKVVVP